MKISTNPIGNYNIQRNNRSGAAVKVKNKTKFKLDNVKINKEEKKFFSELYPAQKEKIMKYHFYNSKGKYSGVAVGNNIDLRG